MVRAGRFRRKPDSEPDIPAILRCLIDIAAGALLTAWPTRPPECCRVSC